MWWQEPVGIVEVAERLGVKRATVDAWIARSIFLERKGVVGGRPAWDWPDVEAWARETGHPRPVNTRDPT